MAANTIDSRFPKPGTKFLVIGAGLPRSGTNSFCAAVSHLLDGPAYQAAVQCALSGTSAHVRALIKILRLRASEKQSNDPLKTREELKRLLSDEMNGWVASADAPLCLLVPELLELYPDAIVICSVRNREKWGKSMWKAARLGNPTVLSWLYFWVPVLRYSPTMWAAQAPIWRELYGVDFKSEKDALTIWDRHHAWLRQNVPQNRLWFVDVTDGWVPLCHALDVAVPGDVPFPRLNDSEALEKTMKDLAVQGLLRWAVVLGGLSLAMSFLWRSLRLF